ncbi:MAG: hypothetical protein HW383_785 [Candidatus Magasanikbacteria bacterium]|nr:hypothetical protein [Candidatus Magasanikbacteria bacterium]
MKPAIHQTLAAGRWCEFTLLEQLGNIGSEVGRALAWDKKGNMDLRDKALERALELFDLTINDPRWKWRLHELTRAREVVCDFFYGDNQYHSTPESLDKYFLYFALAARAAAGR